MKNLQSNFFRIFYFILFIIKCTEEDLVHEDVLMLFHAKDAVNTVSKNQAFARRNPGPRKAAVSAAVSAAAARLSVVASTV
jgi:hypothetical protein